MQDSDRRLTSNRRPIIKSMSCTSVSQIYVNRFSNSQIRVQLSNLWSFPTFSNQRPITLLVYALTNKSVIDLRIWKDVDLRVPLNRSVVGDNDVSGCRFEAGR